MTGKIICGNCGKTYKRTIANSNKPHRKVLYKCTSNLNEQIERCYAGTVSEKAIHEAFVNLYNKLRLNWKTLLTPHLMYLKPLVLLRIDQAEIRKINQQINELLKQEYMNYWPPDEEYLRPILISQRRNSLNVKIKELENADINNANSSQNESRSILENSTWGIRRRFEQGKVTVNHTRFLGYDKDDEGNLVINEKQAKIVRRIYNDFLNGKGPNRIAKELEDEGVRTWDGKTKWYEGTIRKMLSNEKYKGDALLQKTYTVDFLTKKRVENNGEVPQYYVEESHPAIIDKDTWEAVQLEMERRRIFCEKYSIKKLYTSTTDNPFSGRIICGKCGRAYGRKVWNSTDDGLRRIIWRCNDKYTEKCKVGCDNIHVDYEVFYKAFVKAYNAVVLVYPRGKTLNNFANYYHLSATPHVETVVLIEKE